MESAHVSSDIPRTSAPAQRDATLPDGPADPRAALLGRCWAVVESNLLAQAPRIFQEVQHALARSGNQQMVHLARELALKQSALAPAFGLSLRAKYEGAVGEFVGQSKAASSSALGSGLSLVGIDESDVSGQVEQATARLRELVQSEWIDLARRLETLAGRTVPENTLPLYPGIFVRAAADGLGQLGEAPGPLVRSLPAVLAPVLAGCYQAIEQLLAAAGIEARAVVRAAPVLRSAGPATVQRRIPPTIRRDALGQIDEPSLEFDMEATSAPVRKAAAGRAEPVIDREIPEQQPDSWGLREYVRLQAMFGVNASVLMDSAMDRLQQAKESAPGAIVRDAPSRPLVSAMIAAQRLDAAQVAGQVRAQGPGSQSRTAARGPEQGPAGEARKEAGAEPGSEPVGTREYSRRLIGLAALPVHKHTVQLVSRIFARMERDRLLPEPVRSLLVALRFPFMEVALADPSIFVRPEHPARGLINTIATACVNWTPEGAGTRRLLQQIRVAVQYVLSSPGSAAGAFAQAQEQFSVFLAEQSRAAAEPGLIAAREALRAAEERESRAIEVGGFLRGLLAGAPLDPYLRQFLVHDWARVLVEVAEGGPLNDAAQPALFHRLLNVVPDLVWSVQPVTSAQDQKRFVELVPAMLESLRDGVARIGWSTTRFKELVEHLRAWHARSLAASEVPVTAEIFSVSTVRIRLDGFRMDALAGPPHLKPFEVVEEAVHQFLQGQGCGVSHRRVQVQMAATPTVLEAAQAEQIIERWRPGTWFDLRIGRTAMCVRLEGFSASHSLALFSSLTPGTELISLSHASLVACVRLAWMAPVEPVPLVARAFRKVLSDLQRSAQAEADGGNAAS